MSNKKKSRASKTVKPKRNEERISLIKSCLTRVLNLFYLTLLDFVRSFKRHVVNMMVGKREMVAAEDEHLSERKRARLLNKQSKMMAEYRLVVKKGLKEEEKGSPPEDGSHKKIKLEEGGGGSGEKRLNEEEFKKMKKELADRKRSLLQLPRFWVNSTTGISASVFSTDYCNRTPLLLSDIEHLVTYAYGGNALVPPPSRWCSMQKPNRLNGIVVIVVDGVGLTEFVDNEECFSGIMEVFGGEGQNRAIAEFLSPCWYGGSLEREINDWGLVGGQRTPPTDVQGSTANSDDNPPAVEQINEESFQNVLNQLGSVFPISGKVKKKKKILPPTDSFPRPNIILTLPQLIQENYPMPIPSSSISKVSFVPTSDSYSPVNAQSRLFSLDCEMCSTAEDPQALTKIAIVDEELNTVYETLVKPEGEIIDYLTRWSGITKDMMEGLDVTLRDVQERVRGLVKEYPDCVFVGQSLNCDLKALRMTHPYVIDTSVIFNLSGVEGRKSSLRDLAHNLIDLEIQISGDKKAGGHCPVEDASAAMKLVKTKLEKGFTFGNALKNSNFLRQSTKLSLDPCFTSSSFKQNKLDKNVLLVYQSAAESTEEEEPNNPTAKQESPPNGTTSQQITPPAQQQPSKQAHTVTRAVTDSNSSTIKHISTRIYEYFLSIGFYTVGGSDVRKSMQKLDKRISKLYGNLGANSLFVLVCSKQHEGGGGGVCSDAVRRNNGVAFLKCKVSDHVVRRKD